MIGSADSTRLAGKDGSALPTDPVDFTRLANSIRLEGTDDSTRLTDFTGLKVLLTPPVSQTPFLAINSVELQFNILG